MLVAQLRNTVRGYILSKHLSSVGSSKESEVLSVSTTGYSFKTSDGKTSAKYGIFWGPKDDRNVLRELPGGSTNIAAMIKALIDVLCIAKEQEISSKILIYTELNLKGNFRKVLSTWASRDFYKVRSNERIKNFELWQQVYQLLQTSNAEIIHKPAKKDFGPNLVTQAIIQSAPKHVSEVSELCRDEDQENKNALRRLNNGLTLDGIGRVVESKLLQDWPTFYTRAVCKKYSNGFIKAAFAVRLKETTTGHRFTPFPVTIFRAELAAIELSLRVAYEKQMKKVVVETSSAHFIQGWKNRWKTQFGSPMANQEFHDRIVDLVAKFEEVRFRLETSNEQDSRLVEACDVGIWKPLAGKEVAERGLTLEDVCTPHHLLPDENLPMVRIFKSKTALTAGYVKLSPNGEFVSSIAQTRQPEQLVEVLERSVSEGDTGIIIRCDSPKLIRQCEIDLPFWYRNGWRNSRHKRIAKEEHWEKVWMLKNKIKIYWQYMDVPTELDVSINQKLCHR